MIDFISFVVWAYAVYATSYTPKRDVEKKIYTTKYALPFDVWLQIKIKDEPYLLIASNQN